MPDGRLERTRRAYAPISADVERVALLKALDAAWPPLNSPQLSCGCSPIGGWCMLHQPIWSKG